MSFVAALRWIFRPEIIFYCSCGRTQSTGSTGNREYPSGQLTLNSQWLAARMVPTKTSELTPRSWTASVMQALVLRKLLGDRSLPDSAA